MNYLEISDTPLHSIASKKVHSLASYKTVLLKCRENVWSCVDSASPLTSLLHHPLTKRDQVI